MIVLQYSYILTCKISRKELKNFPPCRRIRTRIRLCKEKNKPSGGIHSVSSGVTLSQRTMNIIAYSHHTGIAPFWQVQIFIEKGEIGNLQCKKDEKLILAVADVMEHEGLDFTLEMKALYEHFLSTPPKEKERKNIKTLPS